MSFGAFSLFNFFQQPNTGYQPTSPNTGFIYSGNGESGTIADFNWYFPYVGTNILYNSITTTRYSFNLLADSYGALVPGLSYETISTSFSGNFQAILEFNNFNSSLYGVIYPNLTDSAKGYSQFSGIVSGSPNDTENNISKFSGEITGLSLDVFYCGINFSGEISSNLDNIYTNNQISGIITGETRDNFSNFSEFSGTMWPVINDINNTINLSLTRYSIQTGFLTINIISGDGSSVAFSLIGYQVN